MNLLEWTKEVVRNDKSLNNWFGDRIYEWVPLCDNAIKSIMNGVTYLVVTDRPRDWFNYYIVNNINKISNNRPFVPIYSLMSLVPNSHKTGKIEELDVVEDMLDITFRGEYRYWYIGTEDSNIYKLIKRREDSFVWMFDKEGSGDTFFLKSYTDDLDMQLTDLFRLFNKTLTASMFGEIEF